MVNTHFIVQFHALLSRNNRQFTVQGKASIYVSGYSPWFIRQLSSFSACKIANRSVNRIRFEFGGPVNRLLKSVLVTALSAYILQGYKNHTRCKITTYVHDIHIHINTYIYIPSKPFQKCLQYWWPHVNNFNSFSMHIMALSTWIFLCTVKSLI